MVLNENLYREYLKYQLRPAIESDLTFVNKHGEPNLLALKDEDILQLALEIIYSKFLLEDNSVREVNLNRLEGTKNQKRLIELFEGHLILSNHKCLDYLSYKTVLEL